MIRKSKLLIITILLISNLFLIASYAQNNHSKKHPVLIRDDRTLQPLEEDQNEIHPDPLKARKNYNIGKFYFKRKDWDAALMRFHTAILYKPDFVKAKWMFIQTLKKKEDWKNLLDFTENYLRDPEMKKYYSHLKKLHSIAVKKVLAKTPAK